MACDGKMLLLAVAGSGEWREWASSVEHPYRVAAYLLKQSLDEVCYEFLHIMYQERRLDECHEAPAEGLGAVAARHGCPKSLRWWVGFTYHSHYARRSVINSALEHGSEQVVTCLKDWTFGWQDVCPAARRGVWFLVFVVHRLEKGVLPVGVTNEVVSSGNLFAYQKIKDLGFPVSFSTQTQAVRAGNLRMLMAVTMDIKGVSQDAFHQALACESGVMPMTAYLAHYSPAAAREYMNNNPVHPDAQDIFLDARKP